jgi:uncharacterized repeat protein (TIGR04076 family)
VREDRTLQVEVVDVEGHCPVYHVGDRFFLLDGYRLCAEGPVCMHSLLAIAPYYVALSRGLRPDDLGLSGPGGAAYMQCLDPVRLTGGGTVTLRILRQVQKPVGEPVWTADSSG